MSGIFDGLDPTRQGESIVNGAAHVEEHAEKVKECERWSIAELKLSPDDITWLHEWAGSLFPDQTELNLQYSSRSPKFGLLFLALAAEVCRRETEESEAWPIIRNIGWKPEVKAVLFNKQGAPKPLLCRAIEAACLKFGLRNIVGQHGRMHWFTTIKLQFGLTRTGLTEQLGNWLYLDTLPTVAQLLIRDQENQSESFACLVESLEAYQDGYKQEAELSDMLIASPWILKDWIGNVLAAARRKPAIVRNEWRPAEATSSAPVVGEVEQSIPCIGEVTVLWNEGRVEFAAAMQEEVDSICSSGRYFVSVDDEPKAFFIKQPDGRFARAGGSGREIQFTAKTAHACVAITDGTSEPVAVELVSLFNPHADLEAWVAGTAGRSRHVDVETHSFEPSRSYTFRMPLDAIVEPLDAIAGQWTCDVHKWVLVPRGWSDNLRIILEDAELFAVGELTREPLDSPDWIRTVTVRVTDVCWERATFRLRVSVPPDVRMLGARVFGKAIRFDDCDSRTLKSAPIPIELHDTRGGVEVRLAVMNSGDRRVIRRKENLPLEGLLLNHDGLWQRHGPDREINVGEFRRKKCIVHLPNTSEEIGHPWVALQGYREVGVPTDRPGQVRDLAGWGQPLELAKGRYNRPAGARRMQLASRVIDRGCVLDLIQLAGSVDVIVRLQDPIEPSHEHCLVVWTSEGHLISIGRDDISTTQDGRTWQFSRSASGLDYSGSIIAVAASYRGKRLGAWWTDDWCRFVRYHVCDGHAKEAAALLRWFQLPVLDQRDAGTIQALATGHGLAFANAWLLWRDGGTSWQPTESERISAMENLRPPTADPAWYEVVREILASWEPQPEDAERLVAGFVQIESDLNELLNRLPLASLVERVAEATPLLIGRLVRQWLSSKTEFASQVTPLLRALAGLVRPHANDDRSGHDAEDFDPRVNGLRLSRPFIEQLLETARRQSNGAAVDDHAAENLQTLLQHPNISRLVAAHLLETLEIQNEASHVAT